MLNYEMLFILPGTLAEDEVGGVVDKVKETVSDHGGQKLTIDDLGKNRLAYPIKQIRYGYFQLARFQADPQAVREIQKKLGLFSQLLRILLQKYNPKKQTVKKINYATMEAPVAHQIESQPLEVKEIKIKEKVKEEKPVKKPVEKVSLEDIDKKLDEILQMDVKI